MITITLKEKGESFLFDPLHSLLSVQALWMSGTSSSIQYRDFYPSIQTHTNILLAATYTDSVMIVYWGHFGEQWRVNSKKLWFSVVKGWSDSCGDKLCRSTRHLKQPRLPVVPQSLWERLAKTCEGKKNCFEPCQSSAYLCQAYITGALRKSLKKWASTSSEARELSCVKINIKTLKKNKHSVRAVTDWGKYEESKLLLTKLSTVRRRNSCKEKEKLKFPTR